MTLAPPPFPDRLRIVTRRRGRRRWAALLGGSLLAVIITVLLPLWQVTSVKTALGPGVPGAAARSLAHLRGTPVVLLSLGWVRRLVQVWPAAGDVEVRLQMPGTLLVRSTPAGIAGSVRIGGRWRAVTSRGSLGARLDTPVSPILTGFDLRPGPLRTALSVADRVARETGGRVESVRFILPGDFEVKVVTASRAAGPLVLHVAEAATAGETRWTRMIREGRTPATGWADLRFDNRVVVGGAG
ncbi:MAG: hypothetical protein GXP48_01635 [Acidobacteria bacterium]|nr:hypothetical protein [Acidobacteriota bacterium]